MAKEENKARSITEAKEEDEAQHVIVNKMEDEVGFVAVVSKEDKVRYLIVVIVAIITKAVNETTWLKKLRISSRVYLRM